MGLRVYMGRCIVLTIRMHPTVTERDNCAWYNRTVPRCPVLNSPGRASSDAASPSPTPSNSAATLTSAPPIFIHHIYNVGNCKNIEKPLN